MSFKFYPRANQLDTIKTDTKLAMTSMVQLAGHHPTKQKVTG